MSLFKKKKRQIKKRKGKSSWKKKGVQLEEEKYKI